MEKWLKRKGPGDPPTPNKKSSVAASVTINNVEKSRPLKKPAPTSVTTSVTTTTVMPSTATMAVLPPNSLHLILPRRKIENRRATSSNSILNGASTKSLVSTSISSAPAAISTITPSVQTLSKEAVLKPIGSVLQATADKSGVVSKNVQREVVENISAQRHVASAGSSLYLSSVRPSQSLPTSKIDIILKNRLDARLGKSEIQTRATPSFLPFADGQRSTVGHNQRDKDIEKEKERKVAEHSEQYENEGQVGGVADSRAERVAVTSKARGMDVPLGKGKGISCTVQQSERRVLSERNDRQVDDIVLSDSSDDEVGEVKGIRGEGRGNGRALSEVKGDTQQYLHEIVDLPPSTADILSENIQPSSVDMMVADESIDPVVETASTCSSDSHSASHSASDGRTGAEKVINDDYVIVQAVINYTIENGIIGFEGVRGERVPNIHAWTGLTAQEQEEEEGVRGEVEGDDEGEGEVEIVEDTITAWEDEQVEDNNDGRLKLSTGSAHCTTTTGTGTVLDLTLTPAPIPGTLGSLPIGAEDILSDLIAIRQQTLDDFIIAGGQKIKRAAAYARNVPYPFIRDPAHYCGPMKFLNRLSFQGKVRQLLCDVLCRAVCLTCLSDCLLVCMLIC